MAETHIINIGQLYLFGESFDEPLKGKEMRRIPVMNNAYVSYEKGLITAYGSMDDIQEIEGNTIDADGGSVFPTFVDSHTHIVFHQHRADEFIKRSQGVSYEQIAAEGGGILNSAKKLSGASEDELFEQALLRLNEVVGFGTGAIEIKSGYGLSFEAETKMLRVIKRLKAEKIIPIKATFLGAHAIPTIYKNNRAAYIHQIKEEMIPFISKEGLADYIDVFCDKGFYTVDETRDILTVGKAHGLKAKIHANELGITGGVQVGVEMNAISVDHLECIGDEEINALSKSNTLPTLLPGTSFFLKIPFAPARKIIDAGLPVVLASDYNPGSTPSGNISLLMNLACNYMSMLPEEALSALTLNAAFAIEMQDSHGSISNGKSASLIITKPNSPLIVIPYLYGSNHIAHVIIDGEVVR